MAKKSAIYLDYQIVVEDNTAITVRKDGVQVSNAMSALRDIAAEIGFEIDSKWNTRQTGAKLVDHLNTLTAVKTSKSSDSTVEVPQKEIKLQTSNIDELTAEEMKQIDDILKRLDALEARMTMLEKNLAKSGNTNSVPDKLTIVERYVSSGQRGYRFTDSGSLSFSFRFGYNDDNERLERYTREREKILNKDYDFLGIDCFSSREYIELSNGNFYTFSYIGNTLREVKAFAALIGYKVPEKAKTDVLAAEIVRECGADGWCISGGQALKNTGGVYRVDKVSKQDLIKAINDIYNYYRHSFNMNKPETGGKSERELVEAFMDMLNSATPRELPDNNEIIRQFDEALRIEKMNMKS